MTTGARLECSPDVVGTRRSARHPRCVTGSSPPPPHVHADDRHPVTDVRAGRGAWRTGSAPVAGALRRPAQLGEMRHGGAFVDGHCPDRRSADRQRSGLPAGDGLVVTKFDYLACSLPEAGAIAVELTLSPAALTLGADIGPGSFVELVHQECTIEVRYGGPCGAGGRNPGTGLVRRRVGCSSRFARRLHRRPQGS
jgi:hypothetical protein